MADSRGTVVTIPDRCRSGERVGGAEGEAERDRGELVAGAQPLFPEASREERAHGRHERGAAGHEDAIDRRARRVRLLEESVDAPFERAETIGALWRAVEALNVDLKMALLLRDVVGLSYTEIADSLEITLATVKWRIYKAREEVQAALVREGVGVTTSAAGALSTITE